MNIYGISNGVLVRGASRPIRRTGVGLLEGTNTREAARVVHLYAVLHETGA